jgi:exonuclease VII large subunit
LLQRGYALVEAIEQPGYLRDADQVQAGQVLQITLARGSLEAEVLQVSSEPKTAQ